MEQEFDQKRCNVDNALLFDVSKDGQRIQIKCRKCGSIRTVKLILQPGMVDDAKTLLDSQSGG